MHTERMTIRLPSRDLQSIDTLIKMGEYSSRSEVIRHAVRDFLKRRIAEFLETAEKLKQFQQFNQELESMEEYMKK
ncbi:MAG: transcriptional regulator [Thermoplasmata archaeon]|nr:MAG: transcriptional regulator [Thermoplasmata archaeon]